MGTTSYLLYERDNVSKLVYFECVWCCVWSIVFIGWLCRIVWGSSNTNGDMSNPGSQELQTHSSATTQSLANTASDDIMHIRVVKPPSTPRRRQQSSRRRRLHSVVRRAVGVSASFLLLRGIGAFLGRRRLWVYLMWALSNFYSSIAMIMAGVIALYITMMVLHKSIGFRKQPKSLRVLIFLSGALLAISPIPSCIIAVVYDRQWVTWFPNAVLGICLPLWIGSMYYMLRKIFNQLNNATTKSPVRRAKTMDDQMSHFLSFERMIRGVLIVVAIVSPLSFGYAMYFFVFNRTEHVLTKSHEQESVAVSSLVFLVALAVVTVSVLRYTSQSFQRT